MRALSVAAAIALMPAFSSADTVRCGNLLVSEQSTVAEIVSRCGQPAHREVSTAQPTVRNPNGTLRQLPEVRTEVWTYDRGDNAFPMRVTIVDGKVKSLEIVR